MPDNSVDSIVTDPPYGLNFMGKKWDCSVPSVEIWAECLRVLKPGGHLLAFAGTRTQHRMAVNIEDAGFEIRDMIAWVYGSGFPKSLDVSKSIDACDAAEEQKARRYRFTAWVRSTGATSRQIDDATETNMGVHYTTSASQPAIMTREHLEACRHLFAEVPEWVERECDIRSVESQNMKARSVVAERKATDRRGDGTVVGLGHTGNADITAPATPDAERWQGWGTALKPALETVTFASKPYTDGQELDIIQSNLIRLEARLWLLSSASAAEKSSTSSQSEYGVAFAIAQWSAEEITSTRAALCAQMDTSLFELATTTSLSIVSSWKRILEEALSDGSMSTIETKSSTTIDLKTLRFSLSQITPESIITACSLQGGFSVNACTAASHFNASLLLLQSIRILSATEPAISQEHQKHRGADVKPNLDPCIMARKPLIGTVAANVLEHGTGALNIDGCRVGEFHNVTPSGVDRRNAALAEAGYRPSTYQMGEKAPNTPPGRWPANLIHDSSDEVLAGFPQTGSAARFFYCAKASKRDRDEGLEGFEAGTGLRNNGDGTPRNQAPSNKNIHPTVKPTDLMRYLCRLVTPPKGIVLDPFMGSGSTGKAAVLEGFSFVGMELNADYFKIAQARVSSGNQSNDAQCELFDGVITP
jgi:DNA modification methylase